MKIDCAAVFVMCASRKEALAIADALLKKRLVACANVIGPAESRFWWKGRIDRASEFLVMMKTTLANFPEVERAVRRLHSYEVPEIIALPVAAGSAGYLKWVKMSVKRGGGEGR